MLRHRNVKYLTMMLRHDLRTDAHICGKFASQASLFVHHGRDVNRVYSIDELVINFMLLNFFQLLKLSYQQIMDICKATKYYYHVIFYF